MIILKLLEWDLGNRKLSEQRGQITDLFVALILNSCIRFSLVFRLYYESSSLEK
jgi:hypothetical protein